MRGEKGGRSIEDGPVRAACTYLVEGGGNNVCALVEASTFRIIKGSVAKPIFGPEDRCVSFGSADDVLGYLLVSIGCSQMKCGPTVVIGNQNALSTGSLSNQETQVSI